MDAVLICDESIVSVEIFDQEQELLIMLERQWIDFLFQVVQVFDRLVNDLLFRNFLLEKF